MLKDARLQLGVTQQEIAARVGVSGGALANWESGKLLPSPHLALRVGAALNLDLREYAWLWLLAKASHEPSQTRNPRPRPGKDVP